MRLSEQLKQDHDSGDFGKALEGYSERAKALEEVVEAVSMIGVDFGFGVLDLRPEDIDKAREIMGFDKR